MGFSETQTPAAPWFLPSPSKRHDDQSHRPVLQGQYSLFSTHSTVLLLIFSRPLKLCSGSRSGFRKQNKNASWGSTSPELYREGDSLCVNESLWASSWASDKLEHIAFLTHLKAKKSSVNWATPPLYWFYFSGNFDLHRFVFLGPFSSQQFSDIQKQHTRSED